MAKVAYYEINVDDFKRAQAFYTAVFGWSFKKADIPYEYYTIVSGAEGEQGIDGGMTLRQTPLQPNSGISAFVSTIYVDDIDATLEKITQHDGTVVMPKTFMEGVGNFAYALDTESNTFGVWSK